jgi:single-strand DNA-binding protein
MFQKIILVGYLGKNPELRYFPNGTGVTSFSMATSRKYKDTDETTWFEISVFGNQAEACNQHLHKGSLVLVTGRLKSVDGNPRTYTRKDGTPGASFEVTADDVKFLGGKGTDSQISDDEIAF